MQVLVTGGVRSGKSVYAESLLADRPTVRYVAPGPARDDDDWAARVAAHQARRPASWETVESHDLAGVVAVPEPVLVDCLGTWLTAVADEAGLWEAPVDKALDHVGGLVAAFVRALPADAEVVTNEVGLGVVPEHRSGRVFRDLLGSVNQQVAAAVDEVHLVVAGRVLRL